MVLKILTLGKFTVSVEKLQLPVPTTSLTYDAAIYSSKR